MRYLDNPCNFTTLMASLRPASHYKLLFPATVRPKHSGMTPLSQESLERCTQTLRTDADHELPVMLL